MQRQPQSRDRSRGLPPFHPLYFILILLIVTPTAQAGFLDDPIGTIDRAVLNTIGDPVGDLVDGVKWVGNGIVNGGEESFCSITGGNFCGDFSGDGKIGYRDSWSVADTNDDGQISDAEEQAQDDGTVTDDGDTSGGDGGFLDRCNYPVLQTGCGSSGVEDSSDDGGFLGRCHVPVLQTGCGTTDLGGGEESPEGGEKCGLPKFFRCTWDDLPMSFQVGCPQSWLDQSTCVEFYNLKQSPGQWVWEHTIGALIDKLFHLAGEMGHTIAQHMFNAVDNVLDAFRGVRDTFESWGAWLQGVGSDLATRILSPATLLEERVRKSVPMGGAFAPVVGAVGYVGILGVITFAGLQAVRILTAWATRGLVR